MTLNFGQNSYFVSSFQMMMTKIAFVKYNYETAEPMRNEAGFCITADIGKKMESFTTEISLNMGHEKAVSVSKRPFFFNQCNLLFWK